jgi:hypothetical protein
MTLLNKFSLDHPTREDSLDSQEGTRPDSMVDRMTSWGRVDVGGSISDGMGW